MTGCRVALVADDQRLALGIQTALKKALGHAAFHGKYDTIRNHIGRDTDGVLIVGVAAAAEIEPLVRLVQESSIQHLELSVVIVISNELPPCPELEQLDQHVAARLEWPTAANTLLALVRERLGLGQYLHRHARGNARRSDSSPPAWSDAVADAGADGRAHRPGGGPRRHRPADRRDRHRQDVPGPADARLLAAQAPPLPGRPLRRQPANLVESAFFGHVKGAFTGADRAKIGKFEAAGNGTMLLDEIDTLGLEQQAGLLRVIETGEFEPVGSNETQICTARIIVASNWDLEEAGREGPFPPGPLLPPQRDVVSPAAAARAHRRTSSRWCAAWRRASTPSSARTCSTSSKDALAALRAFPWPGNIRQLENAVQQAVLVSSGPVLLREHLPPPIREYSPAPLNGNGHHKALDESLSNSIDAVERNVIQQALEKHGNSRARAAEALGISRVTLYKKMKKYGLMPATVRVSRVVAE